MIFMKSTFLEKYRKIVHLGFVFGSQNVEKSINQGVETHTFFNFDFEAFFFGFFLAILARFWEALGLQKIAKNRKNSRPGRVWNAFWISARIWDRFWSDFKKFGMDFRTIFRKKLNFFATDCSETSENEAFGII